LRDRQPLEERRGVVRGEGPPQRGCEPLGGRRRGGPRAGPSTPRRGGPGVRRTSENQAGYAASRISAISSALILPPLDRRIRSSASGVNWLRWVFPRKTSTASSPSPRTTPK